MIWWLCPVPPATAPSGGTRKLGDLCMILRQEGFESEMISNEQCLSMAGRGEFKPTDLVVVPDIYGHFIDTWIPRGIPRISFVQNGYLIDQWGIVPNRAHPFVDTPDLKAVMVESQHTIDLIHLRLGDLPVPIIRTHSSGNGRMGELGPFRYGEWPRRKVIMYFGYKHEGQNEAIFGGLVLPAGWELQQLSGTDEDIAEALRTGAIFAAPNTVEGLCAPTQESLISGCVTICWPGGPSRFANFDPQPWIWQIAPEPSQNDSIGGPMEYLGPPGDEQRAVIVTQDDVDLFRDELVRIAVSIDEDPGYWGIQTRAWSAWHCENYSREKERAEICDIMRSLGQVPTREQYGGEGSMS